MLAGVLTYLAYIEEERQDQDPLFYNLNSGTSITFLLGHDKTDVPYFERATEHFVRSEEEKTDLVINSCRTLSCIIEYLNHSSERENRPWSVINIVAHGNPKTGLNLHLYDNEPKATPKRLLQSVLIGSLPKLKEGIVDNQTRINIWSCGIGKNPMINLSLKRIFIPENGDSAQVYCSPHFVIFHPDDNGNIKRVKASYWPYYYKRGYRPSRSEIVQAMKIQYPDEELDWNMALQKEDYQDQVFQQSYHIPISYTRVYNRKEDRPALNTEEDKRTWINDQAEIKEQLGETEIPFDKFNWQVNKIIHTLDNGERVPAIKAIGMATVLNVLKIEE